MNSGCAKNADPQEVHYVITFDDNKVSRNWATYLHYHLTKRMTKKNVLIDKPMKGAKVIHLSVNPGNQCDYCIEQEGQRTVLIAKERRTMLWLIYQLISNLSQSDSNINAEDIPPAVIPMKTTAKDFDFSYREPHFLPNLQFEYAPIIGADMVETAWGLWGHGLEKVVINENQTDSIYAIQNGKENKEQFCFSSINLCQLTKSYIRNHFGDGAEQSYRFMIIPNDNPVVCTCPKCIAAGNTPTDATPSVSNLINKLAKCFPKHLFFTTAYLTVQTAPRSAWPDNTGVMISTINLPKGVPLKPSKPVNQFLKQLREWKERVSHVYIWDYAANFDDWLTPMPILYALQKQLQFFKEQGIEGVFLNASGYDYAPFDDVKTYVSAALMMDVNASVDSLCKQYLAHFYPVSGDELASYYLHLERQARKRNKPYDLYGSLRNSPLFADRERFMAFYDKLEDFISIAQAEERQKLIKLQTALAFTRIQLALLQETGKYGVAQLEDHTLVTRPEMELELERLKRHANYEDMKNHKEEDGALADFIADVEIRLKQPMKNLLIGTPIKVLGESRIDQRNLQTIQNGLLGYINNYHDGWLIVNEETLRLQVQTNEDLRKGENVHFRFLNNRRHNILPPEKILIYKGKEVHAELSPGQEADSRLVELSIPIDLSDTPLLVFEFVKQKGKKATMALDEIIIN